MVGKDKEKQLLLYCLLGHLWIAAYKVFFGLLLKKPGVAFFPSPSCRVTLAIGWHTATGVTPVWSHCGAQGMPTNDLVENIWVQYEAREKILEKRHHFQNTLGEPTVPAAEAGGAHRYEKVPVILVGNKVDLESEREVSLSEGRALAEEWGCPFMETSAKSKTMVDELFAEICAIKHWLGFNCETPQQKQIQEQLISPSKLVCLKWPPREENKRKFNLVLDSHTLELGKEEECRHRSVFPDEAVREFSTVESGLV
ncbi:hypothetical protein IHE44_0005272 [Lamprotornis superbus]|uniref:Uncharacterized protein n=1 Tax=Lamprotornis superbus TaxID=245042 RepID=A0A835NXP2_9PASS|nr:hypothetical protein IHE44_0005272 [Lamprotornis superbus]